MREEFGLRRATNRSQLEGLLTLSPRRPHPVPYKSRGRILGPGFSSTMSVASQFVKTTSTFPTIEFLYFSFFWVAAAATCFTSITTPSINDYFLCIFTKKKDKSYLNDYGCLVSGHWSSYAYSNPIGCSWLSEGVHTKMKSEAVRKRKNLI